MYSKALKKLIFVCSGLLLAALALASDLSEFRDGLEGAKSREEFYARLQQAPDSFRQDSSLAAYAGYTGSTDRGEGDWQTLRLEIVDKIDGRLAAETSGWKGKVSDPRSTARKILEGPLYVDTKKRENRNWLDNAGTRLGNRILQWIEEILRRLRFRMPNIGGLPSLSGLTIVAWFILGAVILLIVYFILVNFKGLGRRKRRVGGILEDDEPERTADQWIEQANALVAQGRHREAVRCLYLACLVRYDDGRVARFRRHETNWEHLYRIEASPQNPTQIDFRSLTQRFDKVWYGHQCKGESDVAEFKEVYIRLCEALQIKIAA